MLDVTYLPISIPPTDGVGIHILRNMGAIVQKAIYFNPD